MGNNHSRLVAESTMAAVIDAKGYKFTKKGTYTFIYCPMHEKSYEGTNKAQQNCYFKGNQNYCYCSVCGKSFNTKEYLIEKENISFGEAYDILYEIAGEPSWYKSNKKLSKKEKQVQKKESAISEIIKFWSGTEQFLYPKEVRSMREVKRKEVVKRMTELETIFGKPNLFQKEKEILK